MIVVGLTGGIGAGKSTVARLLAGKGATVVDADAIVRDLQRPGQAVFAAIVGRFGEGMLAADGTLDRAALASVVFSDRRALEDLNAITHPAVRDEMARQMARAAKRGDEVVVLDIPLIVESAGREGMHLVVTVEADAETRVARLVADRGMSEADARARIASQADAEQRVALAEIVIDNNGDLAALEAQIDAAWTQITARSA